MGEPDWSKDPKFATLLGRKQNEEELDRLIGEWTSTLSPEEVMTKLQSVGVEGAIVKNPEEMYNDPHLKHYLWAEMEHAEIGKYHLQVPSFKLSRTPVQLRRPGPLLGEHNEYVYMNLAGFSREEYEQLQQEGVFE
jgi:crotonobetainyl-CoA:carnitine CoA-transferase CaiB-like acyl-CoA transferase